VNQAAEVTVEFYGIPRQRAGRAELAVRAATITEAMAAVERACPGLTGLVHTGGGLSPHFLLSLEGQRFVSDLRQPLRTGDRLLLLSADAGG
jgi:molybdopterin converting factor small subunit